MARILLIASYGWSRNFHAYQISNGEHLVRSTGFTPQLTEEITSFQPEVIVADLSGEHPRLICFGEPSRHCLNLVPQWFSVRMLITGGRCMSPRMVTMR